jgi:hypothetical protein
VAGFSCNRVQIRANWVRWFDNLRLNFLHPASRRSGLFPQGTGITFRLSAAFPGYNLYVKNFLAELRMRGSLDPHDRPLDPVQHLICVMSKVVCARLVQRFAAG